MSKDWGDMTIDEHQTAMRVLYFQHELRNAIFALSSIIDMISDGPGKGVDVTRLPVDPAYQVGVFDFIREADYLLNSAADVVLPERLTDD